MEYLLHTDQGLDDILTLLISPKMTWIPALWALTLQLEVLTLSCSDYLQTLLFLHSLPSHWTETWVMIWLHFKVFFSQFSRSPSVPGKSVGVGKWSLELLTHPPSATSELCDTAFCFQVKIGLFCAEKPDTDMNHVSNGAHWSPSCLQTLAKDKDSLRRTGFLIY